MARPPFTFDRNAWGSNGSFLSLFIARPAFALAHLKTQAILQHRSKKGQSAFRSTAHLSKGALGPAVDNRFVACCRLIRIIFDESRASVTRPVPCTKAVELLSSESVTERRA